MKLLSVKRLAAIAAIAGVFGFATTAGAQAVLPTDAEWMSGNEETLDLGGATATDETIEALFRLNAANDGLCEEGSLVQVNAGCDGGGTSACYYCRASSVAASAAAGVNAGDEIVVCKNSTGGSAQGCGPVADSDPQDFIDLPNVAADCGAPVAVAADGNNAARFVVECGANACNDARPAECGFSDVECPLLGASPSQVANLTAQAGFHIIFGVPITTNLRDQLQWCQGLDIGSEAADQQPNMPYSLAHSIYTGGLLSWDTVQCDPDGDGIGEPLTSANGPAPPVDSKVYVARRVNTSGTQTFTSAFFTRNGCTSGVLPFLISNSTDNTCEGPSQGAGASCGTQLGGSVGNPSGPTVCCNSGSSGVRGSLDSLNASGGYGVGVLSQESLERAFRDDLGFRFAALEGAWGSFCNVANGDYRFWALNSIQCNASVNTPLEGLLALFVSPDTLTDINADINEEPAAAGVDQGTGNLADPLLGFPPVAAVCTEGSGGANDPLVNPTNTGSRAATGTPNNCAPATYFFNRKSTPINVLPATGSRRQQIKQLIGGQ